MRRLIWPVAIVVAAIPLLPFILTVLGAAGFLVVAVGALMPKPTLSREP